MSASALPGKTWTGEIKKMQYFADFVSPGSAEADNGRGRKLHSRLIASCISNIGVKNY